MKLAIAVTVCNQLHATKVMWGCLIAHTARKHDHELIVVDNGSTDGTVQWLERYVRHQFPRLKVIRNACNVGLFVAGNQAWHACSADVVAYFHNDLAILHPNWDEGVLDVFDDPAVGLLGFVGAASIGVDGGRSDTISNLLEAEEHGKRIAGLHNVVVLDGLALIARRTMLEKVGGWDEGYARHHFYDKDLSLASLAAGYRNVCAGVFCHHESGVTANLLPDDFAVYQKSEAYFFAKWGLKLPQSV